MSGSGWKVRGLGFTNTVGTGECVGGGGCDLGPGRVSCAVSLDSLCIWQVQVYITLY